MPSACPCCKASAASDLKHLVLSCPAWGPHRAEMWAAILEVTSRREVSRVQAGDPGAVLEALLGADRWGVSLRSGVYACPNHLGRHMSLLTDTALGYS